MGSNWQSVDSNFPTFNEGESPYDQIQKLTDYMFQLTETLKYSLNNLDTDNWNSSGLKQFSVELTGDLEKDLTAYGEALTRLQSTVSSLSAKVAAQEQKQADLQNQVTTIKEAAQKQAQAAQTQTQEFKTELSKLAEKLEQTQQEMSKLFLWLQPREDHLILGYAGGRMDLVGDVYINEEVQ